MSSGSLPPFVAWIILGLVAGVLAKLIMPGKDKGGLISTIVIGAVGSLLGGFLGRQLGLTAEAGALDLGGLLTAIAGALVLLLLFRLWKVVF